jgi:transcriptional regulator with XRE-family HTH domain
MCSKALPRRQFLEQAAPQLRIERHLGDLDQHSAKNMDAPMLLSSRVKQLRVAKSWNLEQAANHIGLSRSSLSKIERNEMSPTFHAMQKLAQGFGLDLIDFLSLEKKTPPTGRRSVTRAGEGARHSTPNYELRLLMDDLKKTAFIAIDVSVLARSLSDFSEWDRHENEDFMYVTEGRMVLYTEHYEPVTLAVGDSVYFDARMGHACISSSKKNARAIWISAPVGG